MKTTFALKIAMVLVICSAMLPAAQAQTKSQQNRFWQQAREMSAAKVQFSELALNKSQDQQVQNYAQMTIKNHNEALERLMNNTNANIDQNTNQNGGNVQQKTTSGAASQIQLSKQDQRTYQRLSKLSGPDFDRQYIDAMINSDRDAVSFYEKHAGQQTSANTGNTRQKPGTSTSSDTADFAQYMLPMAQRELQQAQDVQNQLQGSRNNNTNPSNNNSNNNTNRDQNR